MEKVFGILSVFLMIIALPLTIYFTQRSQNYVRYASEQSTDCVPPPDCLSHSPFCSPTAPAGGWCPPGKVPAATAGAKMGCRKKPLCLQFSPPCQVPEPAGGWCHPSLE